MKCESDVMKSGVRVSEICKRVGWEIFIGLKKFR